MDAQYPVGPLADTGADVRHHAGVDHDSSASEALDERRRIIDAAWGVLGRSGFQGLKVGSVVRAVPTSTRTFYRWFVDKDDLVVELVCEEYQRAGRRLAAAMGDAPPGDAIRRWIEAYLSAAIEPSLAARARLFSSLRSATPGGSARSADALDDFLSPLRRTIEDGRRDGSLATDDPRGDAIAIHHLCASALLDALGAEEVAAAGTAAGVTARVNGFVMRALVATADGR